MLAIDVDELFKRDAFNSLSLEQKLGFKNLVKNLEGRNVFESMNYIMGFMSQMPKLAPMPKPQQDAMLAAIAESLPEGDAAKFKNILGMLRK